MPRAGNWTLGRAADDDRVREREHAESQRLVTEARRARVRATRVAERVERMSELYRERLDGRRDQT